MSAKDKILEQRGVNQDMCIETTKDDLVKAETMIVVKSETRIDRILYKSETRRMKQTI